MKKNNDFEGSVIDSYYNESPSIDLNDNNLKQFKETMENSLEKMDTLENLDFNST